MKHRKIKQLKEVKQWICELLDKGDFSEPIIVKLMTRIRDLYHKKGMTGWTYGMSAQLVNTAIKIYLVIKWMAEPRVDFQDYIEHDILQHKYMLLPLSEDTIYKIKYEYGIDFYAMSNHVHFNDCDDVDVFQRYWWDVMNTLPQIPLIYQISEID